MKSEPYSLLVLCSLHASICLLIAAVIFLPIAGLAGSAVLAAIGVGAFTVVRLASRAYHRRRRAPALGQPGGPGLTPD